jgi:hypothetical protein
LPHDALQPEVSQRSLTSSQSAQLPWPLHGLPAEPAHAPLVQRSLRLQNTPSSHGVLSGRLLQSNVQQLDA